ncbi:MAG: ribonuclease HII [Patescibacteria group bacterium]
MDKPTRREENRLHRLGIRRIAGVDEAGRGAWAGPLVAAAVILPHECRIAGLRDSKQLSAKAREDVYRVIVRCAVSFAVSIIPSKKIDRWGVGRANAAALILAVRKLGIVPDFVLVDCYNIEYGQIPSRGIVRGDASVFSIAAASVIAKVTRDRLMDRHHLKNTRYHFDQNRGYGTAAHRSSIARYGLCEQHRRSFKPMRGTYT